MDDTSLELFSVIDDMEVAIKPYRLHSEIAWLIIDTLNEARFLLIHAKGDCRHALPD